MDLPYLDLVARLHGRDIRIGLHDWFPSVK
jgi:hypothetical protein